MDSDTAKVALEAPKVSAEASFEGKPLAAATAAHAHAHAHAIAVAAPTAAAAQSSLASDGQATSAVAHTSRSTPEAETADFRPKHNMIFSDIYKNPRSPIAKLRHHPTALSTPLSNVTPDWVAEEYADLLSRDKAKQKEAVRRYLGAKVKNDWEFQWPPQSPVVVTPEAGLVSKDAVAPESSTTPTPQATTPDMTDPAEPVQDETREDPGYQVDNEAESSDDDDSDAESTYSTVSEDPAHYRPRLEWTSDLSDTEEAPAQSPFRFETPGSVANVVQTALLAKRAQRRRDVRKEAEWNPGLACFEARRDAWTGARTVRVRTKPPVSPPAVSPRSARRLFFRRSLSGSPPSSNISPAQTQASDASDASSLAKDDELCKPQSTDGDAAAPASNQNYPIETLIPIAPPLLPPNNPLRASITPSVYLSLYEKVILNGLQPSCPINLSDMLRSCVAGWKRDGEWPPRPTPAPPPIVRKHKKSGSGNQDGSTTMARRMSLGRFGRDGKDETNATATAKGIRRSLQRALGIGANGVHEVTRPDKA